MNDETTNDAPPTTQPDGTLTLAQRVLIAQDVIARLRSPQKKVTIDQGAYVFLRDSRSLPRSGRLSTKRLKSCDVCARGAFFLASIDRFNHCDAEELRGGNLSDEAYQRTREEWGAQAALVEDCFEGTTYPRPLYDEFMFPWTRVSARNLLVAICENIVANGGVFRPETSLAPPRYEKPDNQLRDDGGDARASR